MDATTYLHSPGAFEPMLRPFGWTPDKGFDGLAIPDWLDEADALVVAQLLDEWRADPGHAIPPAVVGLAHCFEIAMQNNELAQSANRLRGYFWAALSGAVIGGLIVQLTWTF